MINVYKKYVTTSLGSRCKGQVESIYEEFLVLFHLQSFNGVFKLTSKLSVSHSNLL